jgi:long-chain fatty acid transport protein
MSLKKHKLALAIAAAAGMAFSASAFATNGYFAHGYGTKNKGLGGAGVALPQDSMAAATNPAGMVFVGDRLDIGLAIFNPNREYSSTNAGAVVTSAQESDAEYFYIPHIGYNKMLSANQSVGVSIYGNGGMNTDYSRPVFTTAGASGVNLEQLFVNVSYAHKITSNASVGAGAIVAYQRFKAYGLQNFGLQNQGNDESFGYGLRIGGQVDVGGGVTLGAAYQTKMEMDELSKYAGLFAEQGDFDIPSNYTLGVAWKAMKDLTLAFDFQRINYTDVASVSNPGPRSFADVGALGTANGPGFGWEDINVFKLGVQYVTGEWTWRAGWNHGDQPIPTVNEGLFNILAPGVVEDHLTLGFTKTLSKTSEISVAFMHAFSKSVTSTIPAALGGGATELKMDQNEIEFSYGMKF